METAKPFEISKRTVYEAYKRVKSNKGAAGVDGVTIDKFEKDLGNNLYRIWNRMSSGSYFPQPVRVVEIPKSNGKNRRLGIPTIGDRVAQMVVKMRLEPGMEKHFHQSSYGYRPGKSALDAVGKARERCWKYDWVIDMDIKGFFDTIDHELMLKAVQKHTNCKWELMYITRWLKTPAQEQNGEVKERDKGTPQGGVISPLLANLYLHYGFDKWMERNHSEIEFERYADDIVVHCRTEAESNKLKVEIEERLRECELELSQEKTKIVYCKDDRRRGRYENEAFDFLGYTFRPRFVKTKRGQRFIGFNPGVSNKGKKALKERIRSLKLNRKTRIQLDTIAELINPIIRGWVNYYCRFNKTEGLKVLGYVNIVLVNWGKRKFKSFRGSRRRVYRWLGEIAVRDKTLFIHWAMGIKPGVG